MTFQCPSCDKTLRINAKSCSCGWESQPSAKKAESSLLAHSLDHQCQWRAGSDRCRYPVKFFEPGQTKSFCRYHLKTTDPAMGEKIVARSWKDTEEDYQARSNRETYGEGRSRLEQHIWENLHANIGATIEARKALHAAALAELEAA